MSCLLENTRLISGQCPAIDLPGEAPPESPTELPSEETAPLYGERGSALMRGQAMHWVIQLSIPGAVQVGIHEPLNGHTNHLVNDSVNCPLKFDPGAPYMDL